MIKKKFAEEILKIGDCYTVSFAIPSKEWDDHILRDLRAERVKQAVAEYNETGKITTDLVFYCECVTEEGLFDESLREKKQGARVRDITGKKYESYQDIVSHIDDEYLMLGEDAESVRNAIFPVIKEFNQAIDGEEKQKAALKLRAIYEATDGKEQKICDLMQDFTEIKKAWGDFTKPSKEQLDEEDAIRKYMKLPPRSR